MNLPKYCRDCRYRAVRNTINVCNYALLTGLTRRAQPVGDGCCYKVTGKRMEHMATLPPSAASRPFQDTELPRKAVKKAEKAKNPSPKYHKIDSVACEALYRQGYSDRKLSDAAGVTVGAIRAWRARRGLPNNYERHPEGGGQGNAEFEESQGVH